MGLAFDSLGYAKKLRDAGVSSDQAEAHAEAARDFVMAELVTRNDLEVVRCELQASIDGTRHDLDIVRRELEGKIDNQTLRLTVRMGVMIAAAVGLLGTILRLHS